MKLLNRLRAVAQFIPTGSRLADIGTDHARLPVWLVQAGHCSSAIAADLRPGPLESARRTIREAGLEEKIETRLSDGLDAIAPQEADAVAMAGMGGETIAGILHRGWKDWTGKTLVLQPMSKQAELCAWLADHGFAIEDEALAADGDMLYRILLVRPGVWRVENPAWLYAGLPLLTRRDPLLPVYLTAQIQRMERALAGMQAGHSGVHPQADLLRAHLPALYKMKEETERW